ncbi:MBL fold metallo-hydrolase [Actinomadura sp. 21ATH]|uniref:MBL fold metallo-hydrolase n=1 Tax=Actinomadura sp. 21ATH TaxID=1735444 RepID=UPI0035BF2482
MHECESESQVPAVSRRSLLGAAALLGGAAGATMLHAEPAHAERPERHGTQLVLLGTAGGPPPFGNRTGIASALVVNGDTYLIDCGRGAVTQYLRAGLTMPSLKAVFITHLHADHIVDYFSFPLLCAGVQPPQPGLGGMVDVYGPGPGGTPNGPISPKDPAPGLAETTRRANETFAASSNAFITSRFGIDPASMLRVHELPASPAAFTVMENDDLKVTATLVPHGNVRSYAYRFDTDAGSVTFSGDTALSEGLNRLAHRTDVLVHEAVDVSWFRAQGMGEPLIQHMTSVHVDVADIGEVGAASDAREIVLSHLAPGDPAVRGDAAWARAARAGARTAGYTGRIIAGHDLMRIPIG